MQKTAQEIIARIKDVQNSDWMGTQTNDLVSRLSFKDAKQFLTAEATAEKFGEPLVKPPLDEVSEYLSFAWDKANGCRGLSAGRSIDHLKTWLWLAGCDDLVKNHFEEYSHYGKFQLVIASLIVGFDFAAADNGEWVANEGSPSLSVATIEREVSQAREIAEGVKAMLAERAKVAPVMRALLLYRMDWTDAHQGAVLAAIGVVLVLALVVMS